MGAPPSPRAPQKWANLPIICSPSYSIKQQFLLLLEIGMDKHPNTTIEAIAFLSFANANQKECCCTKNTQISQK